MRMSRAEALPPRLCRALARGPRNPSRGRLTILISHACFGTKFVTRVRIVGWSEPNEIREGHFLGGGRAGSARAHAASFCGGDDRTARSASSDACGVLEQTRCE